MPEGDEKQDFLRALAGQEYLAMALSRMTIEEALLSIAGHLRDEGNCTPIDGAKAKELETLAYRWMTTCEP